jgi:hypothetical protein
MKKGSLRLLPSGPDLVQISPFRKIPGEATILHIRFFLDKWRLLKGAVLLFYFGIALRL